MRKSITAPHQREGLIKTTLNSQRMERTIKNQVCWSDNNPLSVPL